MNRKYYLRRFKSIFKNLIAYSMPPSVLLIVRKRLNLVFFVVITVAIAVFFML